MTCSTYTTTQINVNAILVNSQSTSGFSANKKLEDTTTLE